MSYRGAPSCACVVLAFCLAGCSGAEERKTVTYLAGEKASVEKLAYNVVDTQIFPHLGDDAAPRIPQNRFYVVGVSVFNSGESDLPIPGMSLVDDSGKAYEELTDGSAVPHWLGVVRRVQANQTEVGNVVFDAPAGHYKLKLTDDTDPADVFVDIPLSFAHEQMQNETTGTVDAGAEAGSGPSVLPARKK